MLHSAGTAQAEHDSYASASDSKEELKVSIISIMGMYRTGKSFLLDLLMRYLKSEQDSLGAEDNGDPGPSSAEVADLSMVEYLRDVHKLPKKLRSIVMYGIADLDLGEGGEEEVPSAEEGRQRLYKYAKSINRFGPGIGALLACNYGNGELSQAFCRLAAVHGATYVLNYAPTRAEALPASCPAGAGEQRRCPAGPRGRAAWLAPISGAPSEP